MPNTNKDRYQKYDGPKALFGDPQLGWCCELGHNIKQPNGCVHGIYIVGVGQTEDEAIAHAFKKLDSCPRPNQDNK